jgi:hypothetical protein
MFFFPLIFHKNFRTDKIIDMHVFELDRLLSQMVQDYLESLPTPSLSPSNSAVLSLQIIPQQTHSGSLNSSSSNQSTIPLRKSIECLYMIPKVNKKPALLPSHYHLILDNNHRPKSVSNILITSRKSPSSSGLSPHRNQFQRSKNKNFQMKMSRSETDLISALQCNEQQTIYLDGIDDADTLTLCETEEQQQQQQSNIQVLTRQFEQKPNSLPDYSHVKTRTSDMHYATTRTIINDQQQAEDDDDNKLTRPQEQLSPIPSIQTSGIKKFVRNSLQLFITQSQQHKRTEK